jgi:hypothetical protein
MTTSRTPKAGRSRRTYPVEVTHLPLVRCAVCGRTIAHRPGHASAVLTDHYAAAHADLAVEAFRPGAPD